jgi:AcrR family transcriptional regulator
LRVQVPWATILSLGEMVGSDEMRVKKVKGSHSEPISLTEDHRSRVGRQKRERTRALLLHSVLSVCSARNVQNPAVIDDVVKHAQVSRGTFYTYFDSLEEATAELGLEMAEEMVTSIMSVYDVLTDPVMRTATAFQMFLLRSTMDRQWAKFICRIGLLNADNFAFSELNKDIALGIETGDYVIESVRAAADVLMGAKIEAIRRIIISKNDPAYIRAVAGLVLRSLGVSASKADKSVFKAYTRLAIEAPSKISWWRTIE